MRSTQTIMAQTTMALTLMLPLLLDWSLTPVAAFQGVLPIFRPENTYAASSPSMLQQSSGEEQQQSVQDLFSSEGWKPIKKELDSLPVFCCANEKGQALQYSVNEVVKMPFFYCEVSDAEAELVKAKAEMPDDVSDKLGIIPFPLGSAFEMMAQSQAIVVPSTIALEAAGAPAGTNPLGQQIPLFCCMDIMQESEEDGKPVLPLFMVHSEAQEALEEALEADGGDPDKFELVSLSLPRAVELLATVAETPAFHFLPPRASIDYIEKYLQDS